MNTLWQSENQFWPKECHLLSISSIFQGRSPQKEIYGISANMFFFIWEFFCYVGLCFYFYFVSFLVFNIGKNREYKQWVGRRLEKFEKNWVCRNKGKSPAYQRHQTYKIHCPKYLMNIGVHLAHGTFIHSTVAGMTWWQEFEGDCHTALLSKNGDHWINCFHF